MHALLLSHGALQTWLPMHALQLSLVMRSGRGDPEAGRISSGSRVTMHACAPMHALLLRSGRGNPASGRISGRPRADGTCAATL